MKVFKLKNQNKICFFSVLFLSSFFFGGYGQTFDVNHYISIALEHSPLLQKQKNNKAIIELDMKQLNAIYKSPKMSLNSNVMFAPIISKDGNNNKLEWTSKGSTNYIGYDLGASNGGQYQVLTSLNQPLFTNKLYKSQEKNAAILKARNENIVQLTITELQQIVTHQYILCILSQKQLANTSKTIQIIKDQEAQMKVMVKEGVYKLVDLKLLEITLQSSQIEYERLSSEQLTNFNDLNLMCGINDAKLDTLENIELKLSLPQQKPSLFLEQYKLDSLAINAQQEIFELQYLPQINAFTDAGLNATNQPTFNRLGFSIGISASWNLFDGHQKEFKKEQTQLLLENISTDKNYFESQNKIQKNNILSQINSLDSQILLINNQLEEYKKLLELYNIEIKHSLISVLELKTLIKEISGKEQEKTNVLMLKEILINSYNYWNN
ncbi:MAG: TolC family protein [Saprospiraceae bacterium]